MTDRIGALTAMVRTNHLCEKEQKMAQQMLDDFLVKNSDPVGVLRWIRIQASYQGADAIERMNGVMNHTAFNMNSPNHVRSLLITFMNSNLKMFHDKDGRGYTFIVDVILEQSLKNAELASVLAKSLTLVLHLDSERLSALKNELLRLNIPTMPKGVLDFVLPALASIEEKLQKQTDLSSPIGQLALNSPTYLVQFPGIASTSQPKPTENTVKPTGP